MSSINRNGMHPAINDNRPYSSRELAERWGVSDQHVRDLIRLSMFAPFGAIEPRSTVCEGSGLRR